MYNSFIENWVGVETFE